jgi:hypothetical protein
MTYMYPPRDDIPPYFSDPEALVYQVGVSEWVSVSVCVYIYRKRERETETETEREWVSEGGREMERDGERL